MTCFTGVTNWGSIPADRGELGEVLEMLRELSPEMYRRAVGETAALEAVAAQQAMRIALAHIISPPRGDSCQLAAAVVALAIGLPGMESLAAEGRKYGLGKAAMSKRVTQLADKMGLPPSIYMRGEKSRAAYKRNNTTRRHF